MTIAASTKHVGHYLYRRQYCQEEKSLTASL